MTTSGKFRPQKSRRSNDNSDVHPHLTNGIHHERGRHRQSLSRASCLYFLPPYKLVAWGKLVFSCSFEVRVHVWLRHMVTMQGRMPGSSKVPKARSIATRFRGIQSKARLNVTGHYSYCTNSIGTTHVSMALKVCSVLRVIVVAKQVL